MEALSVDHVQFRIFAALCAVLVLKNIGLAVVVAGARGLRGAFVNPEDARLFAKADPKLDDTVERIRRAHANAIENDPFFVIAGLLYLLVGAQETGIQAYGYTYVLARFAHALCYVFSLQPFRTVAFLVALAATTGMAVQVLIRSFA